MTTIPTDSGFDPVQNLSRRGFLQGLASTSALILGSRVSALAPGGKAAVDAFSPDVFLSIDVDGTVTVVAHRSEMGTGIRTCLPVVLIDELGADWERCAIEQAIGDRKYGSQNTDGSNSITGFYQKMRRVGAAARMMLEQAAADRFGVEVSEVETRVHEVVHEASGQSAGFGELVEAAQALEVPSPRDVKLRSEEELRFIGKAFPIVDRSDLVTGQGVFGMDARIDGMVYAAIARPPVLGADVESVDSKAAEKQGGYLQTVQLPRYGGPVHNFQALGGVAVLATNSWAAFQARDRLKIKWTESPNDDYDSKAYRDQLLESVRNDGEVVREEGDFAAAIGECAKTVEAEYILPHLSHAPMEPPVALAQIHEDGSCECWAPTQNPQASQSTVAEALGIEPEKVTVHVTLLGGGFGRKSKPDYVAEAALLAREVGKPVKVVWSREDDIRHDYYHTVAAIRCQGGVDGEGKAKALHARTAFPSISSTFSPASDGPAGFELGMGFMQPPFVVDGLKLEKCKAPAHVRVGWLRSVCNIPHAFAMCSIVDEMANVAGRDSYEFLMESLGEDRTLGRGRGPFRFEVGRLKSVTQAVADGIGWKSDLPKGEGLGIACHRSFNSFVAVAIKVSVSKSGRLSIDDAEIAIDCGHAINLDRVRAQMEGSVVFGISLALHGEVTAKDGAIEQSNFHDYPVARLTEVPSEIGVQIFSEYGRAPAGVGEPGVPPVAPALCNAIYQATGKRVRELPISKADLSWS
ncbi:MAG: molybdopterin cofactor-binding domain-containing protein [Planctomycetota bacterium]